MSKHRFTVLSFLLAAFLSGGMHLNAQTGIYIPSAKPIKNMQKAMTHPEKFCLLINFSGSSATYGVDALDWLDSAYRVTFADRHNPRMYSMTIEGYSSSESLSEERVANVYNYFAGRCYAPFPIRYAVNPIRCHCHGDTVEMVRYEVPVTRKAYRSADLPESRRKLNGSIDLDNCVLVTFADDPDACLGAARGCIVPSMDTTVRGYYASVFMKRGSLYSVEDTKDSCPSDVSFTIEEHLEYRPIVEDYFLVPHKKQYIVQVGYVVLHSSIRREFGECSKVVPDSIYVRFPVTQEQLDNKIRIFGFLLKLLLQILKEPSLRTQRQQRESMPSGVLSLFIFSKKEVIKYERNERTYQQAQGSRPRLLRSGRAYYVGQRVQRTVRTA